ncbi:MAG: RluA family pseudouridine synthase [Treponema sp.]|nr:RluA family pseudouridine synthase [Treponema sp.]
MPSFSINVPDDFSGAVRLDKYMASLPEGMNRSKLKSGIENLTVNGKKAKMSTKVSSGDKIEFDWEDSVPDDIVPEDIPLDVVYEDKNVTVVNKKQGMVTHPACGNWNGTLVNALLFRWGRSKIGIGEDSSNIRPGIVHRLDKDTSGLMITARNRDSEEWLHNQFLNHRLVQKEYIAICVGRPKDLSGRIETNIARDLRDRKKFRATPVGSEGKFSCSIYQCIGIYEAGNETYSLMRVRIKTGRTHQIRVHMKHIGCPILGDPIYGKNPSGVFKTATLMLHSYVLKIRLPFCDTPSTFKAPVPIRFRKVMFVLHKKFRRVR